VKGQCAVCTETPHFLKWRIFQRNPSPAINTFCTLNILFSVPSFQANLQRIKPFNSIQLLRESLANILIQNW
jgi:hypothetical protein